MLPQRNLIYTGITLGKKLVVLIGQKKAASCPKPCVPKCPKLSQKSR
jgi:hypothetical protein